MSRQDLIRFYSYVLENCHWELADIVVKEMKKNLGDIHDDN